MSKIFYDHLIIIDEFDSLIKESTDTVEEREELWKLVDEIIHHKVLDVIFSNLPSQHHQEFLEMFHNAPYDEGHIDYLNERIGNDIEKIIKDEVDKLYDEILRNLPEGE
ncbi:hypothetical protein A2955_00975 [Candidatus Woesebacteria bacterium RIFCSPLOWO2_01_FULL_37_19]|uniref:Uncharacterized protein n=1 Tax=Candidatus Woesebacteria bacterium RIFCSPLOWO2_01_FULL_37_19 TaxID=1802514 RepID=A0A1F8AZQ5_9BACT|nr:MAG: hypothetical protein A2955_00975 [Candidatus Woesebacteria bacterium RIFCSPLOWO2_01_FULL_37_19]